MKKPDFIIIGAMKSATSTLHAQLAEQPGIFMTDPKEPNYFSDDEQYKKGEAWYESLFLDAEINDICGESSTHYTKLPHYPLTIERMSKSLKRPKLIYVIRHPVDRLISHYIHQWSQNVFKCSINEAIEQYDELIDYSCYAKQLKPYIAQFGRENILLVYMETIKESPQFQLEMVANFIGYQGAVIWKTDMPTQNVSKEKIRTFFGYRLLVDSAPMELVRRKFIPKFIRNHIKNKLTMQKRVEVDAVHMEKLISIFDRDLQELSGLLGLDYILSCQGYDKIVLNTINCK